MRFVRALGAEGAPEPDGGLCRLQRGKFGRRGFRIPRRVRRDRHGLPTANTLFANVRSLERLGAGRRRELEAAAEQTLRACARRTAPSEEALLREFCKAGGRAALAPPMRPRLCTPRTARSSCNSSVTGGRRASSVRCSSLKARPTSWLHPGGTYRCGITCTFRPASGRAENCSRMSQNAILGARVTLCLLPCRRRRPRCSCESESVTTMETLDAAACFATFASPSEHTKYTATASSCGSRPTAPTGAGLLSASEAGARPRARDRRRPAGKSPPRVRPARRVRNASLRAPICKPQLDPERADASTRSTHPEQLVAPRAARVPSRSRISRRLRSSDAVSTKRLRDAATSWNLRAQ